MPVTVYKSGIAYNLIPAPMLSVSRQTYNNVGRPGFGSEYSINLEGQLVPTHGNPYYSGGTGNYKVGGWASTPQVESDERVDVSGDALLDATLIKQELIRSLFSNPIESGIAKPLRIQVSGYQGGSGLSFMAFVDDVSFSSDGRGVNPNSYTVSLRTNNFLSSSNSGVGPFGFSSYSNESQPKYFISSFTETYDIQEEGRTTLTWKDATGSSANNTKKLISSDKIYSVSRSITAVGMPVYNETGAYVSGLSPWQQASGYIYDYIGLGVSGVPSGVRTSGINAIITSGYKIGNISYQESVDREAGSYSISESYLAYSGSHPVIETININKDLGEDGVTAISVQGTVEGLHTGVFTPSGSAYQNANTYFTGIIEDSGTGVCTAFKYARSVLETGTNQFAWLHPKPLSKSVARDFNKGVISYTYNFNDRFPNVLPNTISESIQVNDTYPGENFSVTPVIGRSQPVLQYLNSRSEYKRSLSINLTVARPTGAYGLLNKDVIINNTGVLSNSQVTLMKAYLVNTKPSITNTTELNYIFQAANPVNDDNFQVANGKCYHSAPTETWDPKTGNYSYNIEWTYERISNA